MAASATARPAATRVGTLDGVRAIAALSVVATHVATVSELAISASPWAPLANRLNVGVSIFFVLSGFLLHRPFVAARWSGAGVPSLRRYALRRAVRVLPAYWLALTVLALLIPDVVRGVMTGSWWAYYGLLQVYDVGWTYSGISVAWSLSTELAFYVLLPLLALLAVRALGRRSVHAQVRWELAALAASAAVALALRAVFSVSGPPFRTYVNTLPGDWAWFAGGMALAVLAERGRRVGVGERVRRWAPVAAPGLVVLAGAVLLWAAQGPWLPTSPYAFVRFDALQEHLLYLVVATALVGAAVLDSLAPRTLVGRVLGSPPMRWLGEISYGVFLWHLPLAAWLQDRFEPRSSIALGLLTLPLSLVAGAASWYLVERPLTAWATGRAHAARPDVGRAPGEPAVEAAP